MKKDTVIVLALYPNSRGLGYACLEQPQNLIESGIASVRPIGNKKTLERVVKFVEFFKPKIIVLRDADGKHSKRVVALIESITKYAKGINLPVYRYKREQIRDAFEVFGAKTKHEIANQIVEWFKQLKPRVPKIRKEWMDEDYNMGMFDALSLAITHMHVGE